MFVQGTVLSVEKDNARVSLHGKAGIKNIALSDLTMLPKSAEEAPNESSLPALCFCLSDEWCSSTSFSQDITDILGGARSGTQGCAIVGKHEHRAY